MEPSPCTAGGVSKIICDAAYRVLDNEGIARLAGAAGAGLGRVVVVIVVTLLATRLARRALAVVIARAPARSGELGEGVTSVRGRTRVATIGRVVMSGITAFSWAVAGATILSEFGIDLGPLLAGAGIMGIAIGFGAQHLVRDFLAGIFMLLEDQYGVGDVIDAGPAVGTVEAVSLRTTRVRDVEGNLWHIPNGGIERVANKSQDWARAVLDVPVSYDTDVSRAITVIKRVADDVWKRSTPSQIVDEPDVWGVEALGPDGMAIRLVVKTQPLRQWEVARVLRARLKEAFAEEQIDIPFPQRVVWHHDADPSSTSTADSKSR